MTTTCSTTYHLSLGNLIDLCSACRKVSDVQEITEQRKDCFRSDVKALVNEDTLLRTHCCQHKCFPVCPRAQHLLRTQILSPGHKKMFLILFRNILCLQQMFPSLRSPRNNIGQQCVRNNVSSFACRASTLLI